ncbi:hypothetical protein [Altericroceibacterium xinjiangense]|uniref:hypothetical protein n=1 Tax=Altericroceibacterium xinjiangense TaxID=762261 RepID=UPI000F7F529F|nr:hypothetical protein [Altericroceibacterium xinjiangense]
MAQPAYMKRYVIRIATFMLLYIAILVGGLTIARTGLPQWAGLLLALATAAPICGVFWTIFKLIGECDDEYQRLLFTNQTLLATAATLVIATVWQFLTVYDVIEQGPQWIGVVWLAFFGVSGAIVRLRA